MVGPIWQANSSLFDRVMVALLICNSYPTYCTNRIIVSPRVVVRNDEDRDATVAEGEGEVSHALLLRYPDNGVVQPVALLVVNGRGERPLFQVPHSDAAAEVAGDGKVAPRPYEVYLPDVWHYWNLLLAISKRNARTWD